MSSQFSSDTASQVIRLVATHLRLGWAACRTPAIDRHHGRNGMLENELHGCSRFQQDYKLVKAGQMTTQSDAVHEEHVYDGLVPYERLQEIVVYAGGAVIFRGQCDGSFGLPAIAEAARPPG
jgi:hypothetical protein